MQKNDQVESVKLSVDTSGAQEALRRLEEELAGEDTPKENLASGGPRNLPKPSKAKRKRAIVRKSRRANRPAERRRPR